MRHWQQGVSHSRNSKARWEKRLRQLAQMRAAKKRKRLANPPEHEPKMRVVRYPNISWAMRDDLSGETHWMPLASVRDAAMRMSVVAKYYQP